MLKYTEDHEWLRLDSNDHSDLAVFGITAHAQEQLGELIYVELPAPGARFAKGEYTGVVESTKTASDIYAPLDCEIIAVNHALESRPQLVNSAAEGEGWLYKLKICQPLQLQQLLDEEAI